MRSRSQLAVVSTPVDEIREALASAAANGGGVELLPMPQIASRIIALAFDASSDAAQLADLIQRDPTLAGQLMRVANSAVYRPRVPAVSLQQAISWLGMNEVQSLAVALAIRGQVFKVPGHDADIDELWRESLATALWAQTIAKLRGGDEAEIAYLCGLFHAIGRAAVLRLLSRLEAEHGVVCDVRTSSVLLDEFELDFARQVLADWNLPVRISSAVTNWRGFERLTFHRMDAALINAAHQLAVGCLHPDLLQVDYLFSNPAFAELGLTRESLGSLLERADDVRAFIAAL